MGDRPIAFSAPMIKALLEGRKTQTRRILKPKTAIAFDEALAGVEGHSAGDFWVGYAPGDRLWVRERGWIAKSKTAFEPFVGNEALLAPHSPDGTPYKACGSIHMPRWASRLTLAVTDVRVERLQDISEADARAEGVRQTRDGSGTFVGREGPGKWVTPWPTAKEAFLDVWDSIHGHKASDANPWVAAVSFDVAKANIDASPLPAAQGGR